MDIDIAFLRQSIGRSVVEEDLVTPRLVDAYRATLMPYLASVNEPNAPLGLQWCLAPPAVAMNALGPDGHPDKKAEQNSFLPPIPLPRRMWAGGAIETTGALELGDRVSRRSTVKDVTMKAGRSGTLCFVTVEHEYSTRRGAAIVERQDIVYRDEPVKLVKDALPSPLPAASNAASRSAAVEETKPMADKVLEVETSSTLLFRYSALTFNGHRIHYDLPYATENEGYAGLVVHGPLQATLLFNLAATIVGRVPNSFRYRGVAPLIAGQVMQVCAKMLDDGRTAQCWTQTRNGVKSMEATATW